MSTTPPTSTFAALWRIAILVILAASISSISQLTLAPSFGAIPSSVNHATMVAVTFSGAMFAAMNRPRLNASTLVKSAAVILFWVPVAQYLLIGLNGRLGAVGGPILNGFLSCHIATIAAGYEVELSLRRLQLIWALPKTIARFVLPALVVAIFWSTERLLQRSSHAYQGIWTPLHSQLAHAVSFSAMSPSWYLILAIPGAVHSVLFNPHTSNVALNAELARYNWSLVDRRWSATSYISVLDNHVEDYRVMRCDHSLLGGEWRLTDRRRKHEGWKVDEPTYAVFEMLEAVRLVERGRPVADSKAQALVIGLGIGTAPKALISHGINTTIVELDPVVHAFATKHFALPANHTAVIQDAVRWVAEQQHTNANGEPRVTYDYVIHDVFTGGASPLSLFNEQFLSGLRRLAKPDGIIALNYAGDLSLPLTRRVLNTIEHVFNGRSQCKIFRDGPPPTKPSSSPTSTSSTSSFPQQDTRLQNAPDSHRTPPVNDNTAAHKPEDEKDFSNIVVFCRNDAKGGPIKFRQPVQADFLGSKSRQHYLLPKPEHEMPFPIVGIESMSADSGEGRSAPLEIIRAGDEQVWNSQQVESAIRHWYVMRDVVPHAVWDLW